MRTRTFAHLLGIGLCLCLFLAFAIPQCADRYIAEKEQDALDTQRMLFLFERAVRQFKTESDGCEIALRAGGWDSWKHCMGHDAAPCHPLGDAQCGLGVLTRTGRNINLHREDLKNQFKEQVAFEKAAEARTE